MWLEPREPSEHLIVLYITNEINRCSTLPQTDRWSEYGSLRGATIPIKRKWISQWRCGILGKEGRDVASGCFFCGLLRPCGLDAGGERGPRQRYNPKGEANEPNLAHQQGSVH